MNNKRIFVILTLLAATLACNALGGGGSGTAPAATAGAGGGAKATSGAGGSTGTETRSATIAEIQNAAEARESEAAKWQAATVDEQIAAGGGVQTGDESRARLDIDPDKTVLRIAPNTEFTLKTLSPEPTDPVTKFVLDAGKLFAHVTKVLGGGSFEIETPSGVATVRGSLMSAAYSRADRRMIVTCLEGECRLGDAAQTTFTDLHEGEASEIPGAGQVPLAARLMDDTELDDWLENFPELKDLIDRLRKRLHEEATPTPPGGAGGGLTACDHPYLPLRPGASWTYQTTDGSPYTWKVNSVTGDASSATAEMTWSIGGLSGTYTWICDATGIVSYQFGALSTTQFGQIASYEVAEHSGTFFPPADVLVPGYSWTNTYTMKMTFTAAGAENMAGTTSVSDTYSVTGAEPVTFGGQTYDGLQISGRGATDIQISVTGVDVPPTHFESTTTFVLARGVGIVTMTSTSQETSDTTDLVSFNIP